MLFFKYIENLLENILDNVFTQYRTEGISLELLIVELKDLANVMLNGTIDQGMFHIRYFMNHAEVLQEIKKNLSVIFLYFFIISDIFSIIYVYLVSHLGLSIKIYEDYVHNQARKEVLKFLHFILLITILMYIIIIL